MNRIPSSSHVKPLKKVGLARALSKLGYCSRSQAAELIRAGRIRVNGTVRKDPEAPVHLGKDRVEADGQPVGRSRMVYFVMNKPRGIVTTAEDEQDRKTVYEFLAKGTPWVGPVGRLDKASEGLLLLTNDSEWAARVVAPERHLDKNYHVQIATVADHALTRTLEKGVASKEGDFLRAKSARILRHGDRNSWLEIILDEGKNRHIRRMLEHLGMEVLRLIRVAIGPLALGELPKGEVRPLTAEEKRAMDRAMRRSE